MVFNLFDKEGDLIGVEIHEKNKHGVIQVYHVSFRGDWNGVDKNEKKLVREGYFIPCFHKSLVTEKDDKVFPRSSMSAPKNKGGMDLIDWFAGKALQGELSSQYEGGEITDNVKLSSHCYSVAQAMINERLKRTGRSITKIDNEPYGLDVDNKETMV